jgi:hypothetical protein
MTHSPSFLFKILCASDIVGKNALRHSKASTDLPSTRIADGLQRHLHAKQFIFYDYGQPSQLQFGANLMDDAEVLSAGTGGIWSLHTPASLCNAVHSLPDRFQVLPLSLLQ